jgi:biopolymer transport protein ExbD
MGRRLRKYQGTGDPDMTPMLDIVFILLIFFIVTSTFLQEKGIDMAQPPSNDEENQPTNPLPSILVSIDDQNTVFVNNRVVDIGNVSANIQRQIVENGGKSAVVIAPTIEAEHGVVVQVWEAANRAKAAGVVIRKPEDR